MKEIYPRPSFDLLWSIATENEKRAKLDKVVC